jgi:prephenate dehydrogenase
MNKITIGIIGGSGGMGRWLNRFFSGNGHRVMISGRTTELTYRDLSVSSDIVILSVPIDAALTICGEIGPVLKPDQLLMDVCSLKERILARMLESTSAQVIGTHPLFGPFTDSIKKQNIIICPGRGNGWMEWVEAEFESRGGTVTRTDASTHDKNMAVVQGLTHLLTICMGRTLQKLNFSPDDATVFSTPIFKSKLDLVGRLFALDLELYQSLIGKNRYTKDVLEVFLSALDEGKEALMSGQDENGTEYLESIRGFLGPFCKNALAESNTLLSALYPKKITLRNGDAAPGSSPE